MNRQSKDILIDGIKASGAIQTGEFTLASGRKSDIYVDLRKFTMSSYLGNLCDDIARELLGINFNAIGGPGFGAAPLIGGLIATDGKRNGFRFYPRGFLVRPTPKDHGTDPGKLVIGSVMPGDRCVMIEDVVTSGGSLMAAIDAVEREIQGAKVVHAIAILDRGMEVGDKLVARGIGWTALLTIEDLAERAIKEMWKTPDWTSIEGGIAPENQVAVFRRPECIYIYCPYSDENCRMACVHPKEGGSKPGAKEPAHD